MHDWFEHRHIKPCMICICHPPIFKYPQEMLPISPAEALQILIPALTEVQKANYVNGPFQLLKMILGYTHSSCNDGSFRTYISSIRYLFNFSRRGAYQMPCYFFSYPSSPLGGIHLEVMLYYFLSTDLNNSSRHGQFKMVSYKIYLFFYAILQPHICGVGIYPLLTWSAG
jgi:hypothetical protein